MSRDVSRRNPSTRLLVALTAATLLLAGCNGENGTDDGANRTPEADAGANRVVAVGASVTLDAAGSSDPDGDELTFAWRLASAPSASSTSLTPASGETTEFTPDVQGTYAIELTASDGEAEDTATVEVTATDEGTPPDTNEPPQADAGADRDVTVGESVTLDATGSSDPDGDELTFAWRFVTSPGAAPDLGGGDTPTPSFTPEDAGSYTLELTVSDGEENATDRVTVSADPGTPTSTVYVDPTGDDGDPGTRQAPVATLQRALAVAEAEGLQQVFLSDGRYDAEPYDYTVQQRLFIEGESRDGVVLDAGSSDLLTVQAPSDASEAVELFLQDLTLETTGRGIHLPDEETEAHLTRVTCRNAAPCAATGDSALIFPAPGGTLTVRDSSATGPGSDFGFLMIGKNHLIQGSSIRDYGTGVRTFGAAFTLQGVTLENNDAGIDAWLSPDDGSPVIVRGGSQIAGNGVGVRVEDAVVRVTDTTIADSAEHGVRLDGTGDSEVVLTDTTVTRSGFSGARASEGQLEVLGGAFTGNGQGDPDDFVDRAGIYAGGVTSLIVNASAEGPTTLSNNGQDNLAVLRDAEATLRDLVAEDVPNPGAGAFVDTSGGVDVEGATFESNHNGMFVTGGDVTLNDVTLRENGNNGLAYGAGGELRVRDSAFLGNDGDNVQIRDEPSVLDFGTPSDPGGNVLERTADTEWSLSDERPDRDEANGTVLHAEDMLFDYAAGSVTLTGGRTGPDANAGSIQNWRITGANQQIDFGD